MKFFIFFICSLLMFGACDPPKRRPDELLTCTIDGKVVLNEIGRWILWDDRWVNYNEPESTINLTEGLVCIRKVISEETPNN